MTVDVEEPAAEAKAEGVAAFAIGARFAAQYRIAFNREDGVRMLATRLLRDRHRVIRLFSTQKAALDAAQAAFAIAKASRIIPVRRGRVMIFRGNGRGRFSQQIGVER